MITTDLAGFLVSAYSQKKNVLKPAGLHKRCTVEGRELASEEDEKYFRGILF